MNSKKQLYIFSAIAELLPGDDKQRLISLLLSGSGLEPAISFSENRLGVAPDYLYKFLLSFCKELLDSGKEEVLKNVTEFPFQRVSWMLPSEVPENDSRWRKLESVSAT